MRDRSKMRLGDKVSGRMQTRRSAGGVLLLDGYWQFVARNRFGDVLWTEEIHNIITNVGLDDVLDVWLSGGSQITTHYIGLTDGTPTVAAADTMASHGGWTEVTAYSEGARQTWTEAGASSQSITNSASPAQVTISSDSTTIGGAFLTTVSTKGGSTGILKSVGAFSAGDKTLDTSDTLDITLTISAADDGA